MSSYLNFYLVPKKNKEEKYHFLSYSRNNNIYRFFQEVLHPVFIGMEEPLQYQDLTVNDVKKVIEEVEKTIEEQESAQNALCEAFNTIENPGIEYQREYTNEYISNYEYISELEELVSELKGILSWMQDLEYSDFEKVLINID